MKPDLQQSYPFYNVTNSTFDQVEQYLLNMDADVDGYDISSLFTTTEDSSEISSIPFSSTMFSCDFVQSPFCDDPQQFMLASKDFPMELDGFEPIWNDEFKSLCECLEESEGSFPSKQLSIEGEDLWRPSPSMKSESSADIMLTQQPSLTLPEEDMEIDNLLIVLHLLKAWAEAMDNQQRELADVILRCISEKVSPDGETLERLAFYLSQVLENQSDYLKHESFKNVEAALQVVYQTFPDGKFAHYTANSAILEAMPDDAETIHIVDFDIGEGVQWPSLIEAIACRHKTLRLTSMKWEEDCDCPLRWSFEETKRRLYDQAKLFGLKLKVEEMGFDDLVSEMKKMNKRGGRREWLVFNCMAGLPHMGRGRSRRLVVEFLRVAKELLAGFGNCSTSSSRGIITFGDGDACENLKNFTDFGSFFDGYLVHYQALLESIEVNFPHHFAEARIAMECLFVAPYISSLAWFQKWEEIRSSGKAAIFRQGLGWRVGK